jgi:hypothetical protein
MSSIPVLIAELQARGIILSAVEGELRFRGPKDALTSADKDALRLQRSQILDFLRARDAGRKLRAVRGRPGPLTPSVAQEMWYRFGGGPNEGKPVALNIIMLGQFQAVEPEAVSRAIKDVIRRHDTLRTHVTVRGKALEFSLNDAEEFTVEHEDLTGFGTEEAETEVRQRAMAYATPLNPVEGRWLGRARVYAMPGRSAVAAISFSHLVTDAGSRNIVLDELQDALSGVQRSQGDVITYNDFSLAERDLLAGPAGDRLIEYWRHWYAQSPLLLSPRQKTPLLWGAGIRIVNNFTMPRRVLRAASRLADELHTTTFAVHLTIFSLALSRWSGTEDFTVRVLGDKRTSLELSNTVGLMFCADPIRVQASADEDFEIVLRRIAREYDASLSLRLPTLHYYPPQCARPGIEPVDMPNRIPAVFNYFTAGTEREKAAGELQPDATAGMPWPPQIHQMPPALWTRHSAPVFLHLMDYGPKADCSLHFYAGVVSDEEQQSFIETLFSVYQEVLPA